MGGTWLSPIFVRTCAFNDTDCFQLPLLYVIQLQTRQLNFSQPSARFLCFVKADSHETAERCHTMVAAVSSLLSVVANPDALLKLRKLNRSAFAPVSKCHLEENNLEIC